MSVNNPEVQVLSDDGQTCIVKIHGYFSSACTATNKIIQANTLTFGNTSQICNLSITNIQYHVSAASGYVQLQWAGTPTPIASFAKTASGRLAGYMKNNDPSATGDILLYANGLASGDVYSIILTLNKEGGAGGGYANAYASYIVPHY